MINFLGTISAAGVAGYLIMVAFNWFAINYFHAATMPYWIAFTLGFLFTLHRIKIVFQKEVV